MDISSLKELARKLNETGIPLPTLRDPSTGKGSVSLTMTFISFNIVVVGLVGKWANQLEGISLEQALYLLGMCSGLYFMRRVQTNNQTIGSDDKKGSESEAK